MTYIILAAGKGAGLHPLTLRYPKTSYRLNADTTVLQRMVRGIRRFDKAATIVVVVGRFSDAVRAELESYNVVFVKNPFYEVTNSIASLWFARDYLESENVTIVHGDVVLDDDLMEGCLVEATDYPYVLTDGGARKDDSYCVVSQDDCVLVMSKRLADPTSCYACVAKFDAVSSRLLKAEVSAMVDAGMSDQYYEDALVQMVMFKDFQLYCRDVQGARWSAIDSVDDLLSAQRIQADSAL